MNEPDREVPARLSSKPIVAGPGSAVAATLERFHDHPGVLRRSASELEIIHADWPAYPRGKGLRTAIAALSSFPVGTRFFPIDQSDVCTLFVVGHLPKKDVYSQDHCHIAIWDSDVEALVKKECLRGVSVTDDGLMYSDAISLSETGTEIALACELTDDLHLTVLNNVDSHLLARQYGSAVREASIILESALRQASGCDKHGQKLVEECFGLNGVLVPPKSLNAERIELRAIFRRFFRYVRNDFAHRLRHPGLLDASKLLKQCSALLELLDMLRDARASQARGGGHAPQ